MVASDKSSIVQQIPMACADETAAVEFMERQRWGGEASCPRCGDTDVYMMGKRGSEERNARFLWRCRGCTKQFTVRVGTVMEDSPIPLRHWCFAFWAACSSKKGVSALQIKRQTGLTYKSALFLMHRIRWAMADNHSGHKLNGTVEVDETFVGGKPRNRARAPKGDIVKFRRGPAPDFKDRKTPVVAMVQRDGDVRAMVPTDVTALNLRQVIEEHVESTARLMTDERPAYRKIGPDFAGHETVQHSAYEYARGDAHINTAEAFFALLKRGVYGTFHNVSRKHLHRYVSEFEFKWNTRKMDDGERTAAAIRGADGKRLMYRHP